MERQIQNGMGENKSLHLKVTELNTQKTRIESELSKLKAKELRQQEEKKKMSYKKLISSDDYFKDKKYDIMNIVQKVLKPGDVDMELDYMIQEIVEKISSKCFKETWSKEYRDHEFREFNCKISTQDEYLTQRDTVNMYFRIGKYYIHVSRKYDIYDYDPYD